jgi:GH15 family glucan-1,4-alpha-glucosidase
MASLIEDYALIGDTETTALVSVQGSIDWFCAPRFDSAPCFAALLGTPDHGRWLMAPVATPSHIERRYRGDTLVLETVFTTATGTVAVIDFMPLRGSTPIHPDVQVDRPPGSEPPAGESPVSERNPLAASDRRRTERRRGAMRSDPSIIRIVEGRGGTVPMHTDVRVRFDYGEIVPWVRSQDHAGFSAVGGADALVMYADVELNGADYRHEAVFDVGEGDRLVFDLMWFPSHLSPPHPCDTGRCLELTEQWWQRWADQCTYDGPWRAEVLRSLLTLKALTYAPSGGIVAAPTTSLPEWIGGVRNWDYRYCWLRDATFTLNALLDAGYHDEATAWSDWLRCAVAGSPEKMQIMYGVGGERRLTEFEVDWLPGYEGSRPVRIGNAASEQFQLDVYGEVMDMFLTAEQREVKSAPLVGGAGPIVHPTMPGDEVSMARFLVDHVARVWRQPDDGIWEVRGPRRHFVHSKAMAWVAIDRWVQLIDHLGLEDPRQPWCDLRDEIHRDVCLHGFDVALGSFTQYYGSGTLDASLLMLGLIGFLPPTDPRIIGTVDAVQRDLLVDGFVLRYRTDVTPSLSGGPGGPGNPAETGAGVGAGVGAASGAGVDGLPAGEGAFLLTTFWLVDNLVLLGRVDEARAMFERLVGLANDVGLLSEEYDVVASRMLGNFPQAFSHVGLLNSAFNLANSPAGASARVTNRHPSEQSG